MVHIKICGITNLDDALFASDAGADMLGFVFYGKSPRYILPERARDIIGALRTCGSSAKCIGVFVNDGPELIRAVMAKAGLDLAQLHGDEPVGTLSALLPCAFKALRPLGDQDALAAVRNYRTAVSAGAPAFLVDAYDKNKFGGTGARADWTMAAAIAREYPILLAGGLSPDIVADAISAVMPWGVDVSSGVERAPGLKDHAKVQDFIWNAKNASFDLRGIDSKKSPT